jgi:hypothetical protein
VRAGAVDAVARVRWQIDDVPITIRVLLEA